MAVTGAYRYRSVSSTERRLAWLRRLEGIASAKVAGVYKGRRPSIEASRVREPKAQGMRPVDIAILKIGRASVSRVLGCRGFWLIGSPHRRSRAASRERRRSAPSQF
jgi:hypothetical protein